MGEPTRLHEIKYETLSAVAFVHDYIEFHFSEKIIRALSKPIVYIKGSKFSFPENGSRDALCNLIENKVERIDINEGSEIKFTFIDGTILVVPLIHGESAHYVTGDNQPIEIW